MKIKYGNQVIRVEGDGIEQVQRSIKEVARIASENDVVIAREFLVTIRYDPTGETNPTDVVVSHLKEKFPDAEFEMDDEL